jgi:class 3 adenylate cyclase
MKGRPSVREYVFAIASVSAASEAARSRGDLKAAGILRDYYSLVSETVEPSDGRVVKVMGDGVLVVFPLRRAKKAVAALRLLQSAATALWSRLDRRCRVQVKVGAGSLVSGTMGPPGQQRFDVYGTALNDLFQASTDDFLITPELGQRLK